ncbi:MAG TPA: hypothetical protein VFV58_32735 [Blastocatellia bacterium]|nr:hypothetical protein [Blastocatellia bacterium]
MARIPASQRTREELTALIEGRLKVRRATRLGWIITSMARSPAQATELCSISWNFAACF